jgi:hypothetical protein
MDLIGSLSHQLGLEPTDAERVAGSLLGAVKQSAHKQLGEQPAQELDAALPELARWTGGEPVTSDDHIGAWLGGGTGPGGPGGALGVLTPLAAKVQLAPDKLAAAMPLVVSFLRARLNPALLTKLCTVVPFLSHAGGSKPGGTAITDEIGGLVDRG